MRVVEISSITGEDTLIYYRRNYTGVAKLEILTRTEEVKIAFTIEIDPLGRKMVYVEYPFGMTFDYPVLPVTNQLKEKIVKMDNEGALPI